MVHSDAMNKHGYGTVTGKQSKRDGHSSRLLVPEDDSTTLLTAFTKMQYKKFFLVHLKHGFCK
jgi:hypothetical protein